MPITSVIMSVYNETVVQLKKATDSILSQTYQNIEYIIVLDKPDNKEAEVFLSHLEKENPKIVFIKNKSNLKLWASLNIGISHTRGKYIARMDGDDKCDVSKIQKQVEYMEENPEVDLLFTWWEEVDEHWKKTIRIPSKSNFQNIQKTFFYASPILHASMMCKRRIFETYQYPEIDRPEDFGLFIQLISKKYTFDILEENLYTYYIDALNLDKKYRKIRIFSSNFLKILWKNKSSFYKNIYFWWMVLICSIQWILTRNKFLFEVCFGNLQKLYKRVFVKI